MRIYGQITKVEAQDDGAIRVAGVASSGAVDDVDEQVSPEAMKAALPAYMRFGALREMHGLSAAGATLSAEVGDDGLTRIEAHVVDPLAVKKVRLGVYKGFSIGGRVVSRDPKDRNVITKLKLTEISLVDRPCNPDAVIDMWKADRMNATPTNADVIAKAIQLAAAAGKPGRHTEFVVKARDALLAAQGEDDQADPSMLAGQTDPPPQSAPSAQTREQTDPDDKPDRGDLDADLALIQAAHDNMVALGASCGGAQTDDSDADKVSTARDGDRLAKILAENDRLARMIETAVPQIDDLRRTIAALENRLEKVAAEPAAPKTLVGVVRAISKADDVNPGGASTNGMLSAEEFKKYLDSLPEDERGQLQLRAALRQPIAVGGR